MSESLHPLQTTNLIRDSYLRYLKTIYPFQEVELRTQLWRALETPKLLLKGPLLEASPPFESGRSIAQLIGEGLLHPGFRELCSDALPLERPLYLHQDQGISKTVKLGRNLIVATGTGSGKTETFLIPVLNHLLRERDAGTLHQPGVRALFLYPMNALANDQLKRLRRVLEHFPAITFGRYTGETKEEDDAAEKAFRDQFPHELRLEHELISRVQMRDAPPHILLTNYAMLEYLLLRPRDCEFFDGEQGRCWRFIVLDEAHVYDGASGIEIAMLLRRLKDRIVDSEPGRLQCMATSATLGRGVQDFPAVTAFGAQLFGERFEWKDEDPARQDVVEATHLPLAALGTPWGQGTAALYAALQQALSGTRDAVDRIGKLARVAVENGVPSLIITTARQEATVGERQAAVNRFLYFVLRGDRRMRALQERLAGTPYFLEELADDIFPAEEEPQERLISLVDLAVRARPNSASLSLLPARYHVFARALEGAFSCLHAAAHTDAAAGPPRLYLTRQEECPHCAHQVVELATCVRCGAAYVVGRLTRSSEGERLLYLHHLTGQPEGPGSETGYFLLADQTVVLDEDEVVVSGEDLDQIAAEICEPYTLCLKCGALAPGRNVLPGCECGLSAPRVVLQRVDLQGKPELRRCVSCGSRSNAGIIYRFLTGQDAPVSVLATSLYQKLPPSLDPDLEELPGEGRKLLIFSDSRQDAAFFAPYLERTYRQVLRRRLILKTVTEDPVGRTGHLRLQDLIGRLQREAEKAGFFSQSQSYDERQRLMATWLVQELVAWDHRISLEGLGLIQFRLVKPAKWLPPQPLLEAPWNLTDDEAWNLLALLLDTLRLQGAVTFPLSVDVRDEAFAPRNRELFVRQDRADSKKGIFSWVPTRGNNRRLDILQRLLEQTTSLSAEERQKVALETLRGIWKSFTQGSPVWREHLSGENRSRVGVLHRLSHEFWEVVVQEEMNTPLYRCTRCHRISHINLRNLCPTYRCDGTLEPVDKIASDWNENHYRYLYRTLLPIPLTAEEHTAQWTSAAAAEVQEKFVRGELNALSCSTTFELGVDVGELQAVLMRNVPPTTANYVQRAGRAGRRTDSAAFALTYAQRRSHDLSHYARPTRIVAGRIRPPVVVVTNEKIVRRHVHSVLFSAFFRWARDEQGRDFSRVGDFFAPENGAITGPDLLREYVGSRPLRLQQALMRIVPEALQSELELSDWGWLTKLWNAKGDGILDLAVEEVTDDLTLLEQLEQEAVKERNYRRGEHFRRVACTMRGRHLLGFLGSRNVLPKYGFPTDVVEMKTNHLPVAVAQRIELQRDLRIAIAEYAPGGEVVAAKHIWVSGGLNKRLDREWPTYFYAVCPECGRFHRSVRRIEDPCTSCGGSLFGWPKQYGQFIIPEFGFIVADPPRPSGEARPERFYSSRVYFAEYALPHPEGENSVEEPEFDIATALSSDLSTVLQRYSRYGKLAVVNPGRFGRGFRICKACGFAKPAPAESSGKRGRINTKHNNPRTGKDCKGKLYPYHLGHEFLTDVLELRFEGRLASQAGYETWLSLLYALLEGASEALGIRRQDLDGTLYRHNVNLPPAVVLFDAVPGGAGHVRRIADEIKDVFLEAKERVEHCECGEETSCYECLRNYRNQLYHDRLKRGLVRDFLSSLLHGVEA